MAETGRERLLAMLDRATEVDALSNAELIDAVIEDVWVDLDLSSRESQLLGKLLERFQKLAGVDETPGGVTADGNPLWPDVVNDEG